MASLSTKGHFIKIASTYFVTYLQLYVAASSLADCFAFIRPGFQISASNTVEVNETQNWKMTLKLHNSNIYVLLHYIYFIFQTISQIFFEGKKKFFLI